eukprot:5492492-Amphidinium_carterae.1
MPPIVWLALLVVHLPSPSTKAPRYFARVSTTRSFGYLDIMLLQYVPENPAGYEGQEVATHPVGWSPSFLLRENPGYQPNQRTLICAPTPLKARAFYSIKVESSHVSKEGSEVTWRASEYRAMQCTNIRK